MLDVHPPHDGMHGVKDFLLHLFTITCGLFIALFLEGCVEKLHQHHLRDEADSNLQQEIRDNERGLKKTLDAAVMEEKNLIALAKFLQAKSEGKPSSINDISIGYTAGTVSDANWRTATATGALSFMEYGRVQDFAGAYQEQEIFLRLEQETLDEFLQLQSYAAYGFDPERIAPADAKAAMTDVRKTLSHVVALEQVGASLSHAYEGALAGKEHAALSGSNPH